PFETTVLGTGVTVDSVDLTPGSRIIAWCTRGPHRQAIAILDLSAPDGAEWIHAYRHWAA
ncbi:hypothetical protein OS965_42165, partial [Streptomyces sp. H27-G5]|nr:hypothetical protein [Streptomyces sp. H27-G5]